MPDDFQSIPMVQPVLSRQPQYAPEIQRAPYVDPYQLQRPADLPLPQLQMQPGHAYPPMDSQPTAPAPRRNWPMVGPMANYTPEQQDAYVKHAYAFVQAMQEPNGRDRQEWFDRVFHLKSGGRIKQPYSQGFQQAEAEYNQAMGKAAPPAEPNGGHFK